MLSRTELILQMAKKNNEHLNVESSSIVYTESVLNDSKKKDFDIYEYTDSNENTNDEVSSKSSDTIRNEVRNLQVVPVINIHKINSELLSDQLRIKSDVLQIATTEEDMNERQVNDNSEISGSNTSTSNNSKDKDFDIYECIDSNEDTDVSSISTNTIRDEWKNVDVNFDINVPKINSELLSDQIRKRRKHEKKISRCKFCNEDVISTNFLRHLERHNRAESEVRCILEYPKNSKMRRQALLLLRNNTNFDLYLAGTIRPNRKVDIPCSGNTNYYPCAYCKGLFLKSYLKRHAKLCISQKSSRTSDRIQNRHDHLSKSHTIIACASDPTETISKLNVKKQVFDMMRGDEIGYEAKKDILIAHFGESYLKRHKRERMTYACSSRMRELAKLLIRYRQIINDTKITFKEIIHPKNFDNILLTTRDIVGYDPIKKTFTSPSLAMHLGTSLKMICDELIHLVLKQSNGFNYKSESNSKVWLQDIKHFKKLVETRWNIEISSLANKDLQEKRWNKPLLLPLVSDILKFKDGCLKIAKACEKAFCENNDDMKTYTDLVQCTLALIILFNRRRIGDVQFLKIANYNNESKTNLTDFKNILTDMEKVLTSKYKRIINSGKGSRAVVILIPELLQKFINIILKHRPKYILPNNEYVFAIPGSKIQWGKGDVAIRTLAKNMGLENPKAISSNKLRKQIATVMQLLSLTKEEVKQFSAFMGHTQKTHEEFYELPIDIYQTAKVSKLLLLMEKGSMPLEYKGKSLADIEFDSKIEYAMESDNDDDGLSSLKEHINLPNTSKMMNTGSERIPNENVMNFRNIVPNESGNNKKKTNRRKGWSNEEISCIQNDFKSFISKNVYPSGEEMKAFIEKRKISRSVPVLKAKLQHLMKKGAKKI